MNQSSNHVTVEITGGPTVTVAWSAGMTAQDALELAWNKINSTAKFTFGLQYYGTALGYMVFMINETFDSFLSSAEPYFYWEFIVDNIPQNQGIDNTKLIAGSTVTFTFAQYVAAKHAGTTLEAKHTFQRSQVISKK
jgi:hypothetical protein